MKKISSLDHNKKHRAIEYCADPLIFLLIDKLKLSPFLFALVVGLVFSLIQIILTSLAGILIGPGKSVGLLDDPSYYFSNWIGGFSLWWFFAWHPIGTKKMFYGLKDNEVIQLTNDSGKKMWDEFINIQVPHYLGNKWVSILCGCIAFFFSVGVYAPSAMYVHPIASKSIPLSIEYTFWMFYALYCALQIVTRIFIVTILLAKTFKKFVINILPLHPDKAGGLAPLGNYALKTTYLIASLGFVIVFSAFNREYQATGTFGSLRITSELIPAAIAYIILAPTAFIAPLSTAHRAMKTAKDDMLLNLSNTFKKAYADVYQVLTHTDDVNLNIKRLTEIKELYQLTEKFPVWPFNFDTFRIFFTSFLSPIIIACIPEIINAYVTLMKK